MGLVNSDMCNFSCIEKDTVQHYLWCCRFSQCFWKELQNASREKCENCLRISFSIELVLFGIDEKIKTDLVFDEILLHAKYFLYICRIQKTRLNIHNFMKDLQLKYMIDKQMHYTEMKSIEFERKWSPYKQLLNNVT